jgi:hypothetical protein
MHRSSLAVKILLFRKRSIAVISFCLLGCDKSIPIEAPKAPSPNLALGARAQKCPAPGGPKHCSTCRRPRNVIGTTARSPVGNTCHIRYAAWDFPGHRLTRVNLTNVLDEGLKIGEIGRRMNSKVKLVEIGVCRK